MSDATDFQKEMAHMLGIILTILIAFSLLVLVLFVANTRISGQCADHGYPGHLLVDDGYCIRTVDGTDEVVPLEELRDE